MKKSIIVLSMIAIAFALPVLAAKPNPASDNGLNMSGKSTVQHLYLYEKDPSDWTVVEDGGWGKMNFDADSFVFNGHGLEGNMEYALIYYPDPWPGAGGALLGSGITGNSGNVNIKGDFDFSTIPTEADTNEGAKIWLVLADDYDTDAFQLTGWNPEAYLFEYALLE